MKTKFFLLVVLLTVIGSIVVLVQVEEQPPRGYKRFVPNGETPFTITFDYPESWTFTKNVPSRMVFLTEAEYGKPNDGTITDSITIEMYDGKVDELTQQGDHLIATGHFSGTQVLEDSTDVKIGGIFARRIVRFFWPIDKGKLDYIDNGPNPITNTLQTTVLLPGDSQYYVFTLTVDESKKGGPFARGFDRLLASVEFVK